MAKEVKTHREIAWKPEEEKTIHLVDKAAMLVVKGRRASAHKVVLEISEHWERTDGPSCREWVACAPLLREILGAEGAKRAGVAADCQVEKQKLKVVSSLKNLGQW